METLVEYINKHKTKALGFQIFTRYANYSEDRIKLLGKLVPLKSNFLISNRVEIFNQSNSKYLYMYFECSELFPLSEHHRICKKIRDSRHSPYPYYLFSLPHWLIINSTVLEPIVSIKKLKLFTKTVKDNAIIGIDSNLTSDEIEIVKDMLCLLVMGKVPFKWLFVGDSLSLLTLTHANQYLKCIRFGTITWDKIIPFAPLQQICLLPDDDTLAEINCNLGTFKTNNEPIVVGLPKWE